MICHIIQHLGLGGAERFLTNYVKNSGLENRILSFYPSDLDEEVKDKLEYIRVPKLLRPFALRKRLLELNPRFINTFMFSGGFWGRIASPKKVIHHYRTLPFREKFLKRFYVDRLLEKKTSWIIVPSKVVRRELIQLGFDSARIRVFYTGVDDSLFKREEKDFSFPKLLIVARLSPVKQVDKIVEALSFCHKPFELTIVGKGETAKIDALAAALGIRSSVKFLGPVRHSQLPEIYSQHNVILSFSRREGIPNSLIEAAFSGLAVVSNGIGGISEVTKKKTSLEGLADLVDSRSFKDWTVDDKSLEKFKLASSVKALDRFFMGLTPPAL